MNKKSAIKIGFRERLHRFLEVQCVLTRPDMLSMRAQFNNKSFTLTMSEYNDEGDPSSQEECDDIYAAIEAIIEDHNASINT